MQSVTIVAVVETLQYFLHYYRCFHSMTTDHLYIFRSTHIFACQFNVPFRERNHNLFDRYRQSKSNLKMKDLSFYV